MGPKLLYRGVFLQPCDGEIEARLDQGAPPTSMLMMVCEDIGGNLRCFSPVETPARVASHACLHSSSVSITARRYDRVRKSSRCCQQRRMSRAEPLIPKRQAPMRAISTCISGFQGQRSSSVCNRHVRTYQITQRHLSETQGAIANDTPDS